jgi:hypothetical protein
MPGDESLTVDEGTSLESPDTALQHTDLPDDDADIASSTQELEVQGRRGQYVPAGTLAEERKARRAATAKGKELETKLAEATGRVAKLEGDIGQVLPIVNAIRLRPDLLQQALGQTQPSTRQTAGGDSEISDAVALEIAQEYELFDAQGQPDLARGRRAAARTRNMVRSMVDESVQPIRRQTVAAKAASNKATMGAYVRQGDVSQAAVDAAMGMVPDEMLADDNVMSVLYYVARGIDATTGKTAKPAKGVEAPSAPLHTEGGGRRPAGGGQLSDFETAVAKSRGLSADQYRGHLKDLPDYGNPIALE